MGNESHDFSPGDPSTEPQKGPSWDNPRWPLVGGESADEFTQALDPTTMKLAVKEAAKTSGKVMDAAAIEEAAGDSIRAMLMIRLYRVRGHLAADLDPLGLSHRDVPEDLTLEWHGFAGQEDKEVYVGGVFGYEWVKAGELFNVLRRTYCGHVGLEYMHISDTEERRFLQDKFESPEDTIQFTPEGKKAILAAVIRGEQYEAFLGKKYVGTKRFGLDGGESMIPALEAVIKHGGQSGVREIIYGMAHRGRLNVLANVMAKPYKVIFHEFSGGSANPEDVGGSGDVKYHLGTSTDREFDGVEVHMSLVPNPSHLEAVNPVVLGKTRAQQAIRDDLSQHEQVLPVLIHGDAAFAGQGVVWECLGLSGVRGYDTGGCIHFIINNQIGFTTSPKFARSSPYPSDVAKGVQAPILHVNGDDPEAVTFACKLAVEYRQKFGRDIVIDMWCYRRFGHNEGDEPKFTQPLMYGEIGKHPKVSKVYQDRLIEEGTIEDGYAEGLVKEFTDLLEEEFQAAKSYEPNDVDWFAGRWSGLHKPVEGEAARRNVETAIDKKLFDSLGRTLTTVPDDHEIHKTLGRVLKAKSEMFESGDGFDWATAEALAFGSLVTEGYGVRLSGQDSGRGTFSQRHAVWIDQKSEDKYIPLSTLPHGKFEVYDSTLSEYGVLGYEYGFAMADPKTLVLWEAQFGDFANGAQIMIDQFIASGEAKWLRANGLVMLLPHGYEGQGPEHSSARLERFLQLCANDNIQVCNITTPANYFHVLRRQMLRSFRKPMVIMTPKSLLRHPMAKSSADEFQGDHHFMRIKSDTKDIADDKVKRLVLCSGKVAYDLIEKRDEMGIEDISIVRIEQLYPFPGEPLTTRIKRMKNLEEIVWCQEEPENNGAWQFVDRLIEKAATDAGKNLRPIYAGREPAASPATGLAKRHQAQQESLVSVALDLSNSGKTANVTTSRPKKSNKG
ncbi:2-oxoglutarate dehydrogenase E1 component [Pontixanthobacter aestiaquae]|uniref:2-oxoglutarate dehydrogenase E1 component n=1 Tax=Pontixanthobacter aestiaquae TaxID=1509367 RepID=A0A844Z7P9_9SPHN|nr:2-oxoglutarate dehydrogenase E1 component [Pontixanthobacter aestiaquae]MDN3645065.1 2-oxoglutarate dehydrogenase E1 component [Pontixanthobacter aestiaquae]MXO83935.1 2-oxoglutarate dehydrogenase E1 component [Pontixanthobacter aestiaquae]